MVEKPVDDNKFEPYRGKYRKPRTECVTIINDHLYEGRFSPRVNGKRISKNIYAAKREEYEEKLNDEHTERHKIKERMENVMKQTIYEQLGGTYREENGNLVPDVELPEQKSIGKYGQDRCTSTTSKSTAAEGTPPCSVKDGSTPTLPM